MKCMNKGSMTKNLELRERQYQATERGWVLRARLGAM